MSEMLTTAIIDAAVAYLREPRTAVDDGMYWMPIDPDTYSWSLWWSLWDEVGAAIRCVRPLVLLVEAEAAVRGGPS